MRGKLNLSIPIMPGEDQSESHYRALFNVMDEGVVITQLIYDEDGEVIDLIYLDHNPAFKHQTGLPFDIIGKRVSEIFPEYEKDSFSIFANVAKTGVPERHDYYFAPAGRWLDIFVAPCCGTTNDKIFCIYKNITDSKLLEERQKYILKLSDALRPLASPDALQLAAMRILGEHLEIARSQFYVVEPDDEYVISAGGYTNGVEPLTQHLRMDDFGTYIKKAFRLGQTLAVADVTKDPRISADELPAYLQLGFQSYVGIPLIKDGRFVAVVGLHHVEAREWSPQDIAIAEETAERTWAAVEKAKAERALASSEEKYRTLFNSIDEGFCTVEMLFDKEGKAYDYRFLETNPAFSKQTGLDNVAGKTMRELAPDHEETWFEVYGGIARTGIPQRFEHQARSLDRWFDVFAFRIGLPEENKVAVLFTDIAERKLAESSLQEFASTLEEQVETRTSELRESNSELQAIVTQLESFNYIASHDLQEPLRKIQVFISRLEDGSLSSKRHQEYLHLIADASQRMRELIDDLLIYSRLGTRQDTFVNTDLNLILEQVLTEYGELIKEKQALIASDLLPTLPVIPFQIRLLFANLLSNSLKFCEGRPEIRITAAIATLDDLKDYLPTKEPRTFAEITFTDNGIGFDNQYRKKIFGLFQRLSSRKEFKGTGIGLSIVEKIIKDHDGFVRASGKPGEGAVFTIYLPYRQ